MRINIIILIVTILIGAGVTFWLDGTSNPPTVQDAPITASEDTLNSMVPDFTFTDLSGEIYNIKDFRGKVTLINFWATWCAPCVIEFPKLIQLAKDNPHIVMIALSSDINDEKIKNFLTKNKVDLPNFYIARDPKRKITTDLFQTYRLPETVIIAPSGRIVKKIIGDTEWGGQDIQNLLSSLKE
jgi:cytochrome c biogenesis protein CcmG, thiol:disulfide interchange protein DsbE